MKLVSDAEIRKMKFRKFKKRMIDIAEEWYIGFLVLLVKLRILKKP